MAEFVLPEVHPNYTIRGFRPHTPPTTILLLLPTPPPCRPDTPIKLFLIHRGVEDHHLPSTLPPSYRNQAIITPKLYRKLDAPLLKRLLSSQHMPMPGPALIRTTFLVITSLYRVNTIELESPSLIDIIYKRNLVVHGIGIAKYTIKQGRIGSISIPALEQQTTLST